MKIVIIGASGGIGLALVNACIARYPKADILATYHSRQVAFAHPNVEWYALDVTNESEIEQLSDSVGSVNMLINAVGFLHSDEHKPEKSIRHFDQRGFDKNISLNTLPGIWLAKYFSRALKAAKGNTFFVVHSARVGSIEDNKLGGWLSYRVSKAALNMAIKTVSIEWRMKLPNCCVLLFHPGTTDTALSEPFQKNLPENQLHSPLFTAGALMDIINKSGPVDSGTFISFDGTEIDW